MEKIGVIVGNRGFFPSHLCESGRRDMLAAVQRQGLEPVALSPEDTRHGAVESVAEARKCAELLKANREEIIGIVVILPNFGDERAIANSLKLANLDVPVLIQATDDVGSKMTIQERRDSFCGKMSCCNNLRQVGVDYSLTTRHTTDPNSAEFDADLKRFIATCRVVKALRTARLGVIGARPAAFKTVRFSEKLLEYSGISVETLDLAELLGWANKMADAEPEVNAKLESIRAYTSVEDVPEAGLLKMAKLGVGIDRWMAENELTGTAIQCWTALEEFYGVVPCALMSMMSNGLLPSACETDIAGLVGMVALQAASGRPAALLDWNNNFGTEPDKAVVFHCSNLPKDFFSEQKMDFQEIIAGSVGKDNAFGTIVGRVAPGPFSYCRVSTDDINGVVTSYLGQGRFTDDKLLTFGGYGVIEIPDFQDLLQFICRNGFEHHVAATRAEVADAVHDALETYMGWEVYHHS